MTGEAATAIGYIGGMIVEMNETATAAASSMEEQGAATKEIARSVDEAAGGADTASTNSASVASAAGETGEAAQEVLLSASGLIEQSATLRMQVDLFLDKVRAA